MFWKYRKQFFPSESNKSIFHILFRLSLVLYHYENSVEGILEILKELYDFVPFTGDNGYGIYLYQGIVGDQLTIERAVNGHASLRNGFTPKERSKELRFKIDGNRFFSTTVYPKRLKLAYCHKD